MSTLKRTILTMVGPHLLMPARVSGIHEPSPSFRFVEIEAPDERVAGADKIRRHPLRDAERPSSRRERRDELVA